MIACSLLTAERESVNLFIGFNIDDNRYF